MRRLRSLLLEHSLKILHVLDHSIPLHSGYTFRTRAILREQRARGWKTAHITSSKHSKDGPDPEQVDGLTFYRTRPGKGLLARLPVLNQWDVVQTLARRLRQVVELERPDILHAHSPALNGLAALKVGAEKKIPVVYECRAFWEDAAVDHGTTNEGSLRYRMTRALETHVFRNADHVTCICEGLRQDIAARGVPEDRITVIPNAVDIDSFPEHREYDDKLAAELGLNGRPVIGFIGSFYAYEGLSLLLDAVPLIQQQVPDLKVLMVGGGPQDGNLRTQAKSLGETVVFTGRVPHSEVQRYYDLVDIFTYPRLPMRLTDLVTPLKPLEAMAQRHLVVASDVGGHQELIRDGENGRLFKAGEAQALADAVVALFSQRDSWSSYHDAGRRYVEEERNWAASVARYQPVYKRLTGS